MFIPDLNCFTEPLKITFIDGHAYLTILPLTRDILDVHDDCPYTGLAELLTQNNAIHKLNDSGIASLTMTPAPTTISDDEIVEVFTIGGPTPTHRAIVDADMFSDNIGYRPVLFPVDAYELTIDLDFLSREGHKNGDLVTLGTLYLDDTPVKVPQNPSPNGDVINYPPGAAITFGDTSDKPDEQLHWLCMDGLLICDRVLMKNISWNELDDQDLVYGFDEHSDYGDDDDEYDDDAEYAADMLFSAALQREIWDKLPRLDIPKLEILNDLIDHLIPDTDACD